MDTGSSSTRDNPSWAWTAGSGISTAEDLARYAQALVGGGLLNDAMQKQRLASIRPIDPADPKSPGYGLALAQFGPVFGHTGELPGYNSFMGHDPRRKITIIVWSSLAAAPDGRAPAVEMPRPSSATCTVARSPDRGKASSNRLSAATVTTDAAGAEELPRAAVPPHALHAHRPPHPPDGELTFTSAPTRTAKPSSSTPWTR
jgi:CubicO group peptidase (beta-lactamase class C family)